MTNGINTREMILEILLQIDEEGEHSHIAIRNALSKYQFLPKQERLLRQQRVFLKMIWNLLLRPLRSGRWTRLWLPWKK